MRKESGFTLIELMYVVAIIGILASIALPSYQQYINRAQVVEGLSLANYAQKYVTEYYKDTMSFPADNAQAGLPPADKIIGTYTKSVEVKDGIVYVTFGNKAAELNGKVLTMRPATVDGSPASPIAWVCGRSKAVEGMTAIGEHATTLGTAYIPASCR